MRMNEIKVSAEETSFCEQKETKKLFYSAAWVEVLALPYHRARFKKVFRCFFQKALLAFC
jgi:hypothetical protein